MHLCVKSFSVRRVTLLRNKFYRFIVHDIRAYVKLRNERNMTQFAANLLSYKYCCKYNYKYYKFLPNIIKIGQHLTYYSENQKDEFF